MILSISFYSFEMVQQQKNIKKQVRKEQVGKKNQWMI
jgi:hypothetical protein